MTWPTVALGDVATIDRTAVEAAGIADGTVYVGLEHIERGGRLIGHEVIGDFRVASTKFRFTPDHVLYGKLRPYLAKIARPPMAGVCSTDILPVLPGPRIDPQYLLYFLRQPALVDHASARTSGANLPRLSPSELAKFEIPLPPVEEQRRIAAILDTAESVRYRRQLSISLLTNLRAAQLHRLDRDVRKTVLLGQVSEIQGGIQVTSKRAGLPLEVPYLRVANVARGRLDITEVKTIRVTARELARVRLEPDDLLLVEGHGNPTEVGRAARWPGGVPDMVHQNHLIRVRAHPDRYLPVVLEALVNSESARRYFARAGKTTSGLNTISTSNVRALPVPEVDMSIQRGITREVQIIQGRIALAEAQAAEIARLCTSLQARAFSGRL